MASHWWFMENAPKDATHIEVMMQDGSRLMAHYAYDFTGEYQPIFEGWFIRNPHYDNFIQIDTPELWRDLPKKSVQPVSLNDTII